MVFGTGDSGEFGMGDDERGEKNKPELHSWSVSAPFGMLQPLSFSLQAYAD
jgi:alpha-tubulin suppressor-like RCC1 family protein